MSELCLFTNERARRSELEKHGLAPILHADLALGYPRAFGLFARLRAHAAFAPDVEPYLAKLESARRRS